ncbi:MAG: PAS domain-containing protein [Eubacteriales bacterium]|nr:PAS domain-containing protein [Eubacteriales bacterium]
MIDTVTLMKQFCEYDFAERNCEKAIALLSEDIHWFGTADNEDVHSKEEARQYLQEELKATPEPYEIQLLDESFLPVGENSGIAFLRMRFSHSDVLLNIRITAVSRMECGEEKLCSMHFSVADASQQADEFYPVEQHKRKLEQEKMSLALSTMEGGLMGCYMDKGFPFYFINDRMLQYLGYDSEQAFVTDINGMVGNMIHPDDLQSVELSSHEQVAKDGRYTVDYRMRKRDGSYLWVHDIGKLSTDQNGRAVTISVCYDVTKEHREKQRLDDIINAIPGGVAIYKISDIFQTVFFSSGVPELSGYTVEEYNELIKRDAVLMTHPDDREMVIKKAKEAVASHTTADFTFRKLHRDGHTVWVHMQGTVIGEEDGCPLLQCVFHNISAQKEQELLNEHLLHSMTGGVIIYEALDNGTLQIVQYSKGIPELTGHTDMQYSCDAGNGFDIIYEPDRPYMRRALEQLLKTEQPVQTSHHIYHSDGHLVGVHMNANVIGSRNGHPLICAVFIKMSDESNMYQTIAQKSNDGIYVISKETHELLFMNAQAKHAFELDEATEVTAKTCYGLLRKCDACCEDCKVFGTTQEGKPYELYVPYLKKHLQGIPYSIDWSGIPAYVVYVSDITQSKMAAQEITTIYNNIPVAVFRCRFDADWTVFSANDGLFRFLGYTRDEFAAMGNKMSAVIYPADLEIMTGVISKQLKAGKTTAENENRLICKDGTVKWISIKAQLLMDDSGQKYFYCVFVDISKQKRDELRRIASEKNLSVAVSHMSVFYWEIIDFNKGIIRFPQQLQDTFHVKEYYKNYPEYYLTHGAVAPEDHETYRMGVERIYQGQTYSQFDARITTLDRGFVWMRMRITRIDEPGMKPRAVCTAEEIAEYKDLEQRVSTVMKQNSIFTWRYDLKRQVLFPNLQDIWPQGWGVTRRECKPAELANTLHPEDFQPWLDFHEKLKQGESGTSLHIRIRSESSNAYRHILCRYTLMTDRDGVPTYALGSCTDITEQVRQQEKYDSAVQGRYQALSKNVVLIGHCNITKDQLIELEDKTEMNLQQRFGSNRNAFFAGLGTLIPNETERSEFYAATLSEPLSADYALGITHHSATFFLPAMHEKGHEPSWFALSIDTTEQPETGDLMGFLCVTDITESKQQEQMLETVVHRNYDYIAYVNLTEDRMTLYRHREMQKEDPTYRMGQTYCLSAAMLDAAQRLVVPEDREMYLEKASLKKFENELLGSNSYEFSFHVLENGVCRSKRMCIDILDRASGTAVMTRTDVTEMLAQQEQQKNQLSKALQIAEAATQAKSEFLSRMSHEIRTPMNAIIGMTAIAKENRADYDQVGECLDKIDMSSHFLLTLINDILEMSRIESGRTEIKHSEFSFDFLIESIRTVVEPLALKSGLRYEFKNDAQTDSHYIGDVTRIQQVIVNLISNAIKFTKENGRVRFSVCKAGETEKRTNLQFIVEDTGIGMSEEFMQKMFKPFTQEDGSNTSEYGGSGLGLAISKSLIEAMDGTICVESYRGIGSTFTVQLPLGRIHQTATAQMAAEEKKADADLSILNGRHVLMAEDHPLNVMVATKILQRKGVIVVAAENGQIAVEKFRASSVGFYDAILMDIRMPVMDGLDATCAIRGMDRPDAKRIPIIAMTANALDEDRKKTQEVGMNAHLAKPFEPVQLYQMLAEHITQKS